MENATAHRFLIVVAAALAACGDGASSDVPEDTVVLLDTVGDSGPADTFVEGTDTDRPMDAVEDTSSGAGPALLLLGQTGIGEASAAAVDDFVIDLRTGDTFGVGGFALRGDLQPAVYLSLDGVALEPESFEVGEQQVTLDYRVVTGGRYVIDVQPHQGQGAGRFLVRTWCTGGPCADDPVALPDVTLRLLAINDLHGNLAPRDDDSGGVAWLASHAKALRAEVEHSVFVSAGDLVGGSPYLSGRFHDEPTVEAMNVAGLDINGVGNHEFDEGPDELKRLATGGCHPIDGCQDGTPFEGAAFEMLAANVNDATGATLFPPFAVRVYGGVPVGFIGLTLEGTPAVTLASQVESLEFNDEIGTVNALLPRLQAMGVETIVLVLHEGGTQSGGANDCDNFSGGARWIAQGLSDVVDILVTGHTHRTYNCWLGDKLVTSAGASGRWLTKIDMTLNATTRDVWVDDARNRFIDHGLAPDPEVAALVARYEALVAPELAAVVG
ncbi:MAG: 2',3'-cyclic-nucleotide 2'-phosphodiesterase (5'-nucleotidase family), partial [Myxococcota bacterium]